MQQKQLPGHDHVINQYAMLSRRAAIAIPKDYKEAIKNGIQENRIAKVGINHIGKNNERLIQQDCERLEGVIDTLKQQLKEVEEGYKKDRTKREEAGTVVQKKIEGIEAREKGITVELEEIGKQQKGLKIKQN